MPQSSALRCMATKNAALNRAKGCAFGYHRAQSQKRAGGHLAGMHGGSNPGTRIFGNNLCLTDFTGKADPMILKYLFTAFVCSGSVFLQVNAHALSLHSEHVMVVDRATGATLFEKASTSSAPIASVTKLMTAMVSLDQKLDPSEVLTISEDDVDNLKHSTSRLRVGSQLTRGEMLRIALMSSENRAAHALARTAPGGLPAFVAAMNRKALDYGMNGTHYVDPTGLSPENTSTAADLGRLARRVSSYPSITDFTTTSGKTVDVGSHLQSFHNTNPAVGKKGWNFWLSKTGYITEAGRCMVAGITTAGRDVVVVLMGAKSSGARAQDLAQVKAWTSGESAIADHRLTSKHAAGKHSRGAAHIQAQVNDS
jgi:D-alanyl-D-alanine endopeptidase (penicillin-binding protein 7)